MVLVAVVHQGVGKMAKNKTLAEKFLTPAEQQQVTDTVQAMERSTSGEIVPMIVSRSHDYPMAAVTCSVSLALPLALLLTHFLGARFWLGSDNMWLFLGIFTGLYMVFYPLVMRSDRLKCFFLNREQVAREVENGALAAFYSEQLHKTKDANGILIYISVMERRVWILRDSGINAVIEPGAWDSVVDELTAGIRAGQGAEAICGAVRRVGGILAGCFPYEKHDLDELHNLIVR